MSMMATRNATATPLPPNTSNTVELKFAFRAGRKGQHALVPARPRQPVRPGRVPRVAKLMALAIKFDGMIRRGEVRDYAELARLGQITRARATQIMALLNLAPDIQERLLDLPLVTAERDPVTERHLREVVCLVCWDEQQKTFSQLCGTQL